MVTSLRLPNITAADTAGQVQQIKSYLYQLFEHLKRAEGSVTQENTVVYRGVGNGGGGVSPSNNASTDFRHLKALIISSADIVNAYYETIRRRLVGEYEALSDFGTYKEKTAALYEFTSEDFKAKWESFEKILSVTGEEEDTVTVSGYLRAGKIDTDSDGTPIYGLEVGQSDYKDGEAVFRRFARFTPDKLSFYNEGGDEIGSFSGQTLHVTAVEISQDLRLGGYKYDTSDGIIHEWVG